MRFPLLVLALLLWIPSHAAAEWQVKPFVGLTFGGGTTFVDLEDAVGTRNGAFGVGGGYLGDVLGIEGEIATAPGFFQAGGRRLIVRSAVTTVTGNVVITLPRRITGYSLRPYLVAGGGLMRASMDDAVRAFRLSSNLAAFNVGGGVMGFFSDQFGVSWDLRYFRSLRGQEVAPGLSSGDPELSFWRLNMALVIR